MTYHIQHIIEDYLAERHRQSSHEVSDHTLRCFVGMIQTGEAVLEDFRLVGGANLETLVRLSLKDPEICR